MGTKLVLGRAQARARLRLVFINARYKVSKARARLGHKIAELRKARARNVKNKLDFCPKIIKELELSSARLARPGSARLARSLFLTEKLGSNSLAHILKNLELARLVPTLLNTISTAYFLMAF